MLRNTLTVFIAALVLFFWNSISWMVLPLHQKSTKSFSNAAKVADVLLENAPVSGVYELPARTNADGSNVSEEEYQKAFDKGPFMQGFVRISSTNTPMGQRLGGSFLVNFFAVVLIVYVLFLGKVNSREHRVLIALAMGLFTLVIDWLPVMNWFDYPLSYIFPFAVDAVVGSLLAGLVIAFGIPRYYGPGAD
jgi:hypothetical protein